ncbi:MAG: hypothetical protein V1870_03505, partial [Candidatus Aenigmatarchaeota archaeon]
MLTNVYTSDIEDYLKKYVALLSEDSGKPLTLNLNNVDLMYTYLWPKLLKECGYIDTEEVFCSEPIQHFIETFNTIDGIENFLYQNPWGAGKNNGFGIAGFLPGPSLNGSGNSRMDTIDISFTAGNRRNQLIKTVKIACSNPYPLTENPIIKLGYSYLYFSETIRKKIADAIQLETEYRKTKSSGNNPINGICITQKTKNMYGTKVIEIVEDIANDFDVLLSNLFK